MKKIIVVSDKFANASNGNLIMTYSEIILEIEKKPSEKLMIFLEQGLNEQHVEFLRDLIIKQSLDGKVKIISYFDDEYRCKSKNTHKYNDFNTLISEPKKINDTDYSSLLLIDERCAELSDHVTGKHLQFMILIESARQMVNAVTEMFYSNNSMIYLANDLNVVFNNFVYPFKTEIFYSIVESKMKVAGNGKMKVKIDFIQNSEIKSTIFFGFTILNKSFVTSIEEKSINELSSAIRGDL